MSRIRVDAEPLILYPSEIRQGLVMSAAEFKMPVINGMKIDPVLKVTNRLTQPAKLRHNPRDEFGSDYHLRLTRFNTFRVMVPVIFAEMDSLTPDETATFGISCV